MFSVNTNIQHTGTAQRTLIVLRGVGDERRREEGKEGEQEGRRKEGRSLFEGMR